ncbi:MAG: DUF72 domain-containing protein [Bacteroidetes bacterium]|nr:DUF72 domain-containing protein [Bacteroidota bacterium]
MAGLKPQGTVYSGLSGLQLNIPKYKFPPQYRESSRLTYYSTFFNSIEFNSTFYKIPMAVTVARWSDSVNENFRFTFKLWKQITHIKNLNFQRSDVDLFLKTIEHAGEKKGCLLIQFPPGFDIEYSDNLYELLRCIKDFDPENSWKIAVEFRNNSWYKKETYRLLDTFKAAMVIHDIPASATPLTGFNLDFIYLRFHGPESSYRGSYQEDFLSEYSKRIKEWTNKGKIVFVYFNNTMGDAYHNLIRLNELMQLKTSNLKAG